MATSMTETIWRNLSEMQWKKTIRTKGNKKKCEQQRTYKYLGHCLVDLKRKAKDADLTF